MAKTSSNLTWNEIDPTSLTNEQQEAYAAYKAQYTVMKAARERFETAMQADVPAGHRIVCGYNFGKLSVALDAAKVATNKPATSKQSLAAWLATQAAR